MSTSNDIPKEFIGFMVGLGLWVGILGFWFGPMDSLIAFWALVIIWWALIISPLALVLVFSIFLAQIIFSLVKLIFTVVLSCFLWLFIVLVIGICLDMTLREYVRAKQSLQPTATGQLEGEVGREITEARI
jgi:hypothetical protein